MVSAGILVIVGLCSFGIYMKNKDKNDTVEPTQSVLEIEDSKSQVLATPEKHVSSPEIDAPEGLKTYEDVSGSRYFKNLSGEFRFDVPDGFTLGKSGNSYYLRNKDNSIQIALVVTSNEYNSTDEVYMGRTVYTDRMTGIFDNEEHDLVNFGTGGRKEKQLGEYTVQYEETEGWFKNIDERSINKLPAYAYYTRFCTEDSTQLSMETETILFDGSTEIPEYTEELNEISSNPAKGIICIGFSKESKDTVCEIMDNIVKSIRTYEPTAEDMDPSYKLVYYTSSKKDGAKIAYPEGWDVYENSDGMVVIRSTDDDSSPNADMIIEYMADENREFVEDYAQFSGAYEYQLLLPYFTQPVGDTAFNFRTGIRETEVDAAIGNRECIYFEVNDEIVPVSASVRNSMISDNYDVENKRYTFEKNGAQCMLNFLSPAGNDNTKLIDKILTKSRI